MAEHGYWTNAPRQTLSRRRLMRAGSLAGLAGTAAWLLGCSSRGGSKAGSSTGGATEGSAPSASQGLFVVPEAKRGGTIVFNQIYDIGSTGWDLHANFSAGTHNTRDAIDLGLIAHDYRMPAYTQQGGEDLIIGGVAEKWEQVDPLNYVFHLRRNFKWPNQKPMDGRPITAQDVVYSYKRALAPPSSVQAFAYEPISRMELVDNMTVRLVLKKPDWRILPNMDNMNSGIIPEGLAEYFKGDLNPVENGRGAGPWMVKEYRPGQVLRYVPNPSYRAIFGIPYADNFEYRQIADQVKAREAFLSKETQKSTIATGQLAAYQKARPDAKYSLGKMAKTNVYCFFMKNTVAPFSDVRVRRAFSLATDRNGWGKVLGEGAKWESGPVTWGVPDWKVDPDTMPADIKQWLQLDLQKAKQLLSAAGIKEGTEIPLNEQAIIPASTKAVAVLLADWMSRIGIKIKIVDWEYGKYITEAYTGAYTGILFGPDQLDRYGSMLTDRMYPGNNRNHSDVRDDDVKTLLDQFSAAKDVPSAKEISKRLQMISVDRAFALYNPQPLANLAWAPELKNYEGHSELFYMEGRRAAWQWLEPA